MILLTGLITELIRSISIYCLVNTKNTQGNNIMEFIVISLFIFIFVAWFALVRDFHREDQKRDVIQKLFDDGIN